MAKQKDTDTKQLDNGTTLYNIVKFWLDWVLQYIGKPMSKTYPTSPPKVTYHYKTQKGGSKPCFVMVNGIYQGSKLFSKGWLGQYLVDTLPDVKARTDLVGYFKDHKGPHNIQVAQYVPKDIVVALRKGTWACLKHLKGLKACPPNVLNQGLDMPVQDAPQDVPPVQDVKADTK